MTAKHIIWIYPNVSYLSKNFTPRMWKNSCMSAWLPLRLQIPASLAVLLLQRALAARELTEAISSVFTSRCSQQRSGHRGEADISNQITLFIPFYCGPYQKKKNNKKNPTAPGRREWLTSTRIDFFFFFFWHCDFFFLLLSLLVNQHSRDHLIWYFYSGGALAGRLPSASFLGRPAAGGQTPSIRHSEDKRRTSASISQWVCVRKTLVFPDPR